MKERESGRWALLLPPALLIGGWTLVAVVNRLRYPEWLTGTGVRVYSLCLLLANLALLAALMDLAVRSVARWAARSRRGGPSAALADLLPLLLLAGYAGLHLAHTSRFYVGVFNYLALLGAA